MTTTFKGWGGAWGDSWGPVVVDPNAMYGSATLHFSAIGQITSGTHAPGDISGAASFSISAIAEASAAPPARPKANGSYGRTEKQHGRRWRLPERKHSRDRSVREREDFFTLF